MLAGNLYLAIDYIGKILSKLEIPTIVLGMRVCLFPLVAGLSILQLFLQAFTMSKFAEIKSFVLLHHVILARGLSSKQKPLVRITLRSM